MDDRHVVVDASTLEDLLGLVKQLCTDAMEDEVLGKVVIVAEFAHFDALRGAAAELRARALTPA